MRRLVIETATAHCSVALIDGAEVIDEANVVVGRGHAERLVPMIAALPERGRADAILVGCGPGSFTGIRVGLAAARALGLAWGVPVSGYSTMALLAASGAQEDDGDDVAVALTGGHGEIFLQSFTRDPLAAHGALVSLPPADAAARTAQHLVIGSGASALVESRGWGEAREVLPFAAGARRLPVGFAALPPDPIYGRAPDARPPA